MVDTFSVAKFPTGLKIIVFFKVIETSVKKWKNIIVCACVFFFLRFQWIKWYVKNYFPYSTDKTVDTSQILESEFGLLCDCTDWKAAFISRDSNDSWRLRWRHRGATEKKQVTVFLRDLHLGTEAKKVEGIMNLNRKAEWNRARIWKRNVRMRLSEAV